MKVRVYRNLDRPFTLFGIKGRFIAVAGILAGGSIVIAIVVGSIAGTFGGIAAAVVMLALGYLAITELQQRFGTQALSRSIDTIGMPRFIRIDSKVWRH